MILQGNARIELKIGGITVRVNAGDERMRRIAQIDEKIWDLIDVLTVQTEPEDKGVTRGLLELRSTGLQPSIQQARRCVGYAVLKLHARKVSTQSR